MLLCRVLAACKGPDDRVLIPGFYDGVRPPEPPEKSAIDAIPFDTAAAAAQLGASRLSGPHDVGPMERMMFQPTFTVTGLQSGYTGQRFQNAVPATAVAHIDIRYVPDQDPDRLRQRVEAFVTRIAPEISVEADRPMAPSRTPMDTWPARMVAQALERGFGVAPLLLPCSGGSAPDSLFTRDLGLPSIWAHVANSDMRNHAPNENIRIDRIRGAARATAALVLSMAQMLKEGEGP
jgi:acetylornithine deacetylase/succinyl-diaminopimelate desuccinylase-like protein